MPSHKDYPPISNRFRHHARLPGSGQRVDLRGPVHVREHERQVDLVLLTCARKWAGRPDRYQTYCSLGWCMTLARSPVPAEILAKPTAIALGTKWSRPAEKGYEILRTWVSAAGAEIIREHHERMDASGYPGTCVVNRYAPKAYLAVADVMESWRRTDLPCRAGTASRTEEDHQGHLVRRASGR